MPKAKTAYTLDAYVYLGKGSCPTNVPFAHFFTLKLTETSHGTNRNLTCDNWFTRFQLHKNCWKNRNKKQ